MSILANPVSGASRIVALLGNPVGHSLSPAIHNHIYATLKIPYLYVPLAIPTGALAATLSTLRSVQCAGANVTIPYKQDVIPLCDELSDESKLIGAVNTLYWKDSRLYGTSTDGGGFFRAIQSVGININERNVLILGNGGTARTLCMALAHQTSAKSITLCGRNGALVNNLANEIQEKSSREIARVTFTENSLLSYTKKCTLLINCTNVGMHPHTQFSPLELSFFHKEMYVFDAIYNPVQTQFLEYAHKAGCAYQNGLRMLLFQALLSHEFFTSTSADVSMFNLEELEQLLIIAR